MSNSLGNENLLSFNGSENFRKNLLSRNLTPYQVVGGFPNRAPFPENRYFETILSDYSPKNSPEISDELFANAQQATISNRYSEGTKIDAAEMIGQNAGAVSMQQAGLGDTSSTPSEQKPPYSYSTTKLEVISQLFINSTAVVNKFAPTTGYDSFIATDNIVPKTKTASHEYPNYTVLNNSLLSLANNDSISNKYRPNNGFGDTYQIGIKIPTKSDGGSQEYPNFSNETNLSKEFQNEAAAINKFIPNDGYTYKVSLGLNVIPKSKQNNNEYYYSTTKSEELIRKVKEEVAINRYHPTGGIYNLYTNSLNSLSKLNGGSQEYTLFSNPIGQNSLENQLKAAVINKFKPNGGYTYEVSLGLNSINNQTKSEGEYDGPTYSEESILSKTKEEVVNNRYQPTGGIYNLYSTTYKTLPKLNGGQEYPNYSQTENERNKEIRNLSNVVNKFGPDGGFINQIFLSLNSLNKGDGEPKEYLTSNLEENSILKNTQKEISINKYTVDDGDLSVYTNRIITLPRTSGNLGQYRNSNLYDFEISISEKERAAAINTYSPDGGYTYQAELKLVTVNKGQRGEYNYSEINDEDLITKTKEESAINKYKPVGGIYNVYTNSLFTLPQNNSNGQYPNFSIDNVNATEYQKRAAASNRYRPIGGFIGEFSLTSVMLPKKEGASTEYQKNQSDDLKLLNDTQNELSINRYTALGGQLSVYTNNLKILPKITSGSEEYLNTDIFNLDATLTSQQGAASINAFIPDGGYNYQVQLGINTVIKQGIKGEYKNSEERTEENINEYKSEISTNRYQPAGEVNLYSNSLNTLTKIQPGAVEYPNFSFMNNLGQEFQTEALTSNRYTPIGGVSDTFLINSVLLPKNSSSETEYPNNVKTDPILIEKTQKEIAINRYTALGGQLNVYSNLVSILPKITKGSEEYINSESTTFTISKEEQNNAAAINKYGPPNGYNQELFLILNSIAKGETKSEYSTNTNYIPESTIDAQNGAATVNRYIPDNGYNITFTNQENILAKTGGDTNEYPNNLKPDEEILDESIGKIAVNRYYPNDGISYVYNVQSTILGNSFYPTREYPNFIIPDEGLLDSNLSDVNALLNGNINTAINPQDSYLQQLSTRFLAQSLQERIAREVQRQTVGRVNLQAFSDPFSLSLLVSGQQPLVYKNFRITVPDGVFDQAADLIQRFTGTYIPVSPIEGEYFTTYPEREQTKIGGLIRSVLSIFTKPSTPTNRSSKFLNNTGSGQRSVLFANLGFNVYRPKYDKNTTQVGQAIDNFFDALGNPLGIGDNSIGNLYIPFDTEDIQNLSNPLGLDEIGKTFEGTELDNYKFGLKSTSYDDDRDPTGGLSWTQSSTINLAGKFIGPAGEQGPQSPVYNGNVQDKFNASRTDKISFRERTLLKRTQDIVNDTPASGAKRLTSVGNAINQVSKVFNDGYKEMTKGSKARKYVTKNGVEVGQEYGRVFTKDLPYLTYNNLQTTIANESGLETNGNIRKFTNSIVDSTYNLNIAPTFGQDSTNIKNGQVKKYMFSIENLAWRNTDEFNTLPDCEKGPNGGRIMWFPPYELKVGSESSSPSFNATNFLGRPEPIYTYENTKRSGSISWKIIVDHPSVMDIVLKYELNRTDGNTATQVVNSFFAGLKKYDIYELAKKYNTVSLTTLENLYQSLLQSNQTSDEVKEATLNTIGPESNTLPTSNDTTDFTQDYVGLGFYFPVLYPALFDNYENIYDIYVNTYKTQYVSQNNSQPPVINFFDNFLNNSKTKMDDLRNKTSELLESENSIVEITLQKIKPFGLPTNEGSWVSSIINYFIKHKLPNGKTIEELYYNTKFTIKIDPETITNTNPISSSGAGLPVNCESIQSNLLVDYSFEACACRGVLIKKIVVTPNENTPKNTEANQESSPTPDSQVGLKPEQNINIGSDTTGISKRIIRELLTETNYFEVLKKDQSFIYDTIKTKFKFFNPAFHSMTPEGLNSRLVFLNQCVRPGKTIPVKQEDGTSVSNDSFNTNFGTPPILILRIGDFYNTKIIPTSLSFTYNDTWDMNPEGIGFQPMIVDVSLGFDMIGGHGLAGPVERLQNALSFNYYANTEIYDERAVPTEDTTAIDNALLSSIRNNEPLPVINNAGSVENDLGKTFGDIVDSTPFSGGQQTGVIQYKNYFNGFIDNTRSYFQETFNVYETTVTQYNRGIWGQLMFERNFTNGDCLTLQSAVTITLLGKPTDYQTALQALAEDYVDNINNDRLYEAIQNAKTADTISNSVKNKMIDNFSQYITSTASSNFNSLSTSIQDLSDVQLKLTTTMEVMDYISFSGDAKVLNDGSTKFYYLSGQTEDNENTLSAFSTDYQEVIKNITGYTDLTKQLFITEIEDKSKGFYILPGNVSFQYLDSYAYTLFSEIILDNTKKESFVDAVVKDVNPDFSGVSKTIVNNFLNTYWIKIFQAEKDYESEYIETVKNDTDFQTYKNFNPQVNGKSISTKERKISFTTSGTSTNYETAYNNIKSSQNSNNDVSTFNGKKQYNG